MDDPNLCAWCVVEAGCYTCSGCRQIAYCSGECRARDWAALHRRECRFLRFVRAFGASGMPKTARLTFRLLLLLGAQGFAQIGTETSTGRTWRDFNRLSVADQVSTLSGGDVPWVAGREELLQLSHQLHSVWATRTGTPCLGKCRVCKTIRPQHLRPLYRSNPEQCLFADGWPLSSLWIGAVPGSKSLQPQLQTHHSP